MRILLWSNYWPVIGGIETWAAGLAASLRAAGHEVAVITSGPVGKADAACEQVDGIDVHYLPLWHALESRTPATIHRAKRDVLAVFRVFAPDVVHYNFNGYTELFFLATARAVEVPALMTVHGFWPELARRPGSALHRALAAADWITGVSDAVVAALREASPGVAGRTSRIYPGIHDPGPVRVPQGSDPPVLLYVGRLAHEKGPDLLLEAFARVARTRPGVRLVVAGDGPDRAALTAQAERLGLDGAVECRGWVAPVDVPALMQEAAAVLVPSRFEGFGLTALEAAACARPVAASATGGLAEVVDDGVTGLLVPPENPAALAQAAVQLLDAPARRAAMGRAGRDRALGRFTVGEQTRAYEQLYEKLGSGRALLQR